MWAVVDCPTCKTKIPGIHWRSHSQAGTKQLKDKLVELGKKWYSILNGVSHLDCAEHVLNITEYLEEVVDLLSQSGAENRVPVADKGCSPSRELVVSPQSSRIRESRWQETKPNPQLNQRPVPPQPVVSLKPPVPVQNIKLQDSRWQTPPKTSQLLVPLQPVIPSQPRVRSQPVVHQQPRVGSQPAVTPKALMSLQPTPSQSSFMQQVSQATPQLQQALRAAILSHLEQARLQPTSQFSSLLDHHSSGPSTQLLTTQLPLTLSKEFSRLPLNMQQQVLTTFKQLKSRVTVNAQRHSFPISPTNSLPGKPVNWNAGILGPSPGPFSPSAPMPSAVRIPVAIPTPLNSAIPIARGNANFSNQDRSLGPSPNSSKNRKRNKPRWKNRLLKESRVEPPSKQLKLSQAATTALQDKPLSELGLLQQLKDEAGAVVEQYLGSDTVKRKSAEQRPRRVYLYMVARAFLQAKKHRSQKRSNNDEFFVRASEQEVEKLSKNGRKKVLFLRKLYSLAKAKSTDSFAEFIETVGKKIAHDRLPFGSWMSQEKLESTSTGKQKSSKAGGADVAKPGPSTSESNKKETQEPPKEKEFAIPGMLSSFLKMFKENQDGVKTEQENAGNGEKDT